MTVDTHTIGRHERLMRRCLELARQALSAGEVPVGSLVADGDRIVGEGAEATRRDLDPAAHAEVRAIQEACRAVGSMDLAGFTLYSTVEPCVLCAYVIRRTRIAHVVFGIPAGHLGGGSSSYPLLTGDASPWPDAPAVTSGVLAEECEALMRQRTQRGR